MTREADLKQYIERAVELGADAAAIIDAGSVVTAAWVRLKCQFGCSGYESSLCCPPHSPTPQEMKEVIACYRRALLIHCTENASPTEIAATLEREIFLDGFYKALGLGCGPCNVCETCNLDQCTEPDKARPAIEACGIDVYATVRANGFPIEVVKEHSCQENCYGLVLID